MEKETVIPFLSLERITAMHDEEIRQAALSVIESGWYLQGQQIKRFETNYATFTGNRHCIATANGLDALTLMIRGYMEMGLLNEDDEIIVPANTYIATILAITENKLTPVLVEPHEENFQINDEEILKVLSTRTKGVMIVHLYGYDAFTEKIAEICKCHNLLLFEDFAQAHGLEQKSIRYGLRGAAAHSFYPGKNMGALADAGAVTTSDDELEPVVRALANYGSEKKYIFKYKGRNSRMDELSAAVLNVKIKYLHQDNARRQTIATRYLTEITNQALTLPPADGVHHIFPVLTAQRDQLQRYLAENGIGTIIHYPIPPHKQECYKEWNSLNLPITERIHQQELSLPLNQALTDEEVSRIITIVNRWSAPA